MNKPLFSVLCYNINSYDKFRDLDESVINPLAEYVYLTNDKSITSNTWTIKYIEFNDDEDIWDICSKIRYNPFRFVKSDICVKMDASLSINVDLTPMIEKLINENYEAAVLLPAHRDTLFEEYVCWIENRKYPLEQAKKCLGFLTKQNFDVFNYHGLYCGGLSIQKNTKMNNDWNRITYSLLKFLSNDKKSCERPNQTISSFVLNKYFSDTKILPLKSTIISNNEFSWFSHGTDKLITFPHLIKSHLFNKPCEPYSIL